MLADRRWYGLGVVFLSLFVGISPSTAQKKSDSHEPIHTHHPRNWRFAMPEGDPDKGRKAFLKFDCQFCHEVRGEDFPFAGVDYGPELSQMGSMHPLEYFAESVINPSAWASNQDRTPDGKSTMPSYNDRMTVRELIDLSAYLASLRLPGSAGFVTASGEIVAVAPQSREVIIAHDAIEGVMDAMTMGYKVRSQALLKGIKPGDKVRFTLDTEKRSVTKIVKVGQ